MKPSFDEHIKILADTGVDIIILEAMSSQAQIVETLLECSSKINIPTWLSISCVFDENKDVNLGYDDDINKSEPQIYENLKEAMKKFSKLHYGPVLIAHSNINVTEEAVKILKKNSNAAMLFYDKDEKIQVRLKVKAIINHNNDITKQSWEKTQHISRKCYLVDNGPGTESDVPTSGLKPELDNFDYTKEQSEEGYKNFTVIQCKIKSIEWLYLAAKGHRRARFDLENNKDNWLVP